MVETRETAALDQEKAVTPPVTLVLPPGVLEMSARLDRIIAALSGCGDLQILDGRGMSVFWLSYKGILPQGTDNYDISYRIEYFVGDDWHLLLSLSNIYESTAHKILAAEAEGMGRRYRLIREVKSRYVVKEIGIPLPASPTEVPPCQTPADNG